MGDVNRHHKRVSSSRGECARRHLSGVAPIVPGTYRGSLAVHEREQKRVAFELDDLRWKRSRELFEAESPGGRGDQAGLAPRIGVIGSYLDQSQGQQVHALDGPAIVRGPSLRLPP